MSQHHRVGLHLIVFGIYLYSSQYYLTTLKMPRRPGFEYAGHFKFLTYWNLVIHCAFFGLSLLNDVLGYPQRLNRFLDNLFTIIVMPVGLFVVAVFWALYSVDRELILPKALDPYYPFWLNHVSHTLIFPVLLLECYVNYHPHPSRKKGITRLLLFTLVYLTWLLYLGIIKNIWVYPVLEVLQWEMRILFFLSCAIFMAALYVLGEIINKKVQRIKIKVSIKSS